MNFTRKTSQIPLETIPFPMLIYVTRKHYNRNSNFRFISNSAEILVVLAYHISEISPPEFSCGTTTVIDVVWKRMLLGNSEQKVFSEIKSDPPWIHLKFDGTFDQQLKVWSPQNLFIRKEKRFLTMSQRATVIE